MSDTIEISYHVYNSLFDIYLEDLPLQIQLVVQLIYSITAVYVLEMTPTVIATFESRFKT